MWCGFNWSNQFYTYVKHYCFKGRTHSFWVSVNRVLLCKHFGLSLRLFASFNVAYTRHPAAVGCHLCISLILQKKAPMQLLCFPKTQILLQSFITNIFSYRVRTHWKLLRTLWFLIPWTTLSGWYSEGYALKSAKICFHSMMYFFISVNAISKRREIMNFGSVYRR